MSGRRSSAGTGKWQRRSARHGGRAESVSAWVNAALIENAAKDRDLAALAEAVASYEAEHGVIDERELAEPARTDRQAAAEARAASRRAQRDADLRRWRPARALAGVDVTALDEWLGRRAGLVLGRAGASDVVGAAVVALVDDDDRIVTSDPLDIQRLVEASGRHVDVLCV